MPSGVVWETGKNGMSGRGGLQCPEILFANSVSQHAAHAYHAVLPLRDLKNSLYAFSISNNICHQHSAEGDLDSLVVIALL